MKPQKQMEHEIRAKQLYRAYETVGKMLTNRKYVVPRNEDFVNFPRLKQRVENGMRNSEMNFLATPMDSEDIDSDDARKIYLIFHDEGKRLARCAWLMCLTRAGPSSQVEQQGHQEICTSTRLARPSD